jgi:hypothetical protein
LSRIEELRGNPSLFDFGYVGLSPAANFYRNVATAKPAEFAEFAKTLYSSGLAFLGGRKVSPSASVRTIDYGEIAVSRSRPMPPQADWMLMVALRDSESWLTDPEGLDAPSVLALASREYGDFYQSTGWYSSVRFDADTSRAAINGLPLAADGSNHVTIWLRTKSDMVGLMGPVMMLSLVTPTLYDMQADTVSFQYWATGRDFAWVQKISDFEASYLGATVAQLA